MKTPRDYLQGNIDAWQEEAANYVDHAEATWADAEWAAQWPAEEAWIVRTQLISGGPK